MTPKEMIIKARFALLQDEPFFGLLVAGKPLTEDNMFPSMATDGYEIRYNAEYVKKMPPENLKTVCGHEAMHIAMEHHRRRGDRDHMLFNIAADLAVNWMLREAGFDLWPGMLVDVDLGGYTERNLSAEAIYDKLLDIYGTPEAAWDAIMGQCRPARGGQPGQPNQQPNPPGSDPGGAGEILDAPTEKQSGEAIAKEHEDLATARQLAKAMEGRGNIPGSLDRAVDGVLTKPINWYSYLAAFVDRNASDDFCYTRPSKAYIAGGIIMPSLYSQSFDLVLGVDVSGSVSDHQLAQMESAINDILSTLPHVHLTVAYFDTHIRKVEEFVRQDFPIKLSSPGGGGTDFCPLYAAAEKLERVTCLICLTDLDGTMPATPPTFPVLWVAIPYTQPWSITNVPFGDVVKMEA